jgi:hypothetical protein
VVVVVDAAGVVVDAAGNEAVASVGVVAVDAEASDAADITNAVETRRPSPKLTPAVSSAVL